ncbi:hypothetical protein [Flagellimonas onchidii]|uniref:hypothetical protein n=1 Tax=Flagellimonas onchidii TaxID=2562684 RepID=UPI0010A5D358|nr:hypothetical protein [Allomuricauda onchidii]
MGNPWNSLETTKLVISIIIPIIGGLIAWQLAKLGKDLESKQWLNKTVIEKRLEFYDRVVPDLNDLFCYYKRVGNWKELTPPEVILKKRKLDREFNIYAHLFEETDSVMLKYNTYIHNCFKTYTGWGKDAKIRMDLSKRIKLANWNPKWEELFVPEEQINNDLFEKSYDQLIYVIRRELGI